MIPSDNSPEDIGALYRVTWDDGQQNLIPPSQLSEEDRMQAMMLERFERAQWQVRGPDTVLVGLNDRGSWETLTVVEGTHTEDVERGMTTFGQSDESPGEGGTVVSRLEELADKIRDFFSRARSRDRGMDQ